MEPNTVPIGRIELPDDWEPEGIICARVPIPDDPQYFSMLIGLVDQLRNSALFERDPTRTGAAIVSRTWENALNSMPIIIINCEGDEMPTILRDDPADPCNVQQSIDGGATWFHAFTKDCGESGGVETPTDEAAEAAGHFIYNLWVKITELLNEENTMNEFQTDYCAWLDTIGVTVDATNGGPYENCQDAGEALWEQWGAMTGPQKAAAIDPCSYMPMFEEIQSCFDDGGLIDWLNCASEALAGWLNETSTALMATLNAVAAGITGADAQSASNYDGGGGGAGFGGDCAGVFECIDFDNTPGGFVRVGGFGQWVDGLGWKAQLNGSKWECRIRKSSGFPATTPGNVKVVYNPTGNSKVAQLYLNGVMVKEQLGGSAGYRELNYTPTGPITSVEIYVSQNTLNSTLTIDELCITE